MPSPLLTAGIGLKPEHIGAACAARAPGLWFEVHAENYMVDGGPRLHALQAVRACHPVSLHGVAMSLAGTDAPDASHLARLRALVQRVEPVLVSEHLAWSGQSGLYLPDLLPFVRSHTALARIARHVERVQDALGRSIAIENPSHYLQIPGHEMDETDFLAGLVRRSGCTLLLDLNNVFVSAHNLGFDATGWIDRLLDEGLASHISELHLAGHSVDAHVEGGLLVDSHDAPVAPPVWALYRHFIERAGTRPTLVERDAEVPPFETLLDERHQAHALATQATQTPRRRNARTTELAPCH